MASSEGKASLDGSKAKVERAKEHLEALYNEINAFIDREPHAVIPHIDIDRATYRAYLRVYETPDDLRWGVLLGDFLHNARSALDHLVWQLVVLNGAKPGTNNQFPIATRGHRYWCSTKDGKPSLRDGMLRGVADEHRTLIDGLQPYRRGQGAHLDRLAILASLSNADKHRFVHPALVAIEEPDLSAFVIHAAQEGEAEIAVTSGPLGDGTEVITVRLDPTATPNVQMQAPLELGIGFGERGLRAEVLGEVLAEVRGIVDHFDREVFLG